MPFENASRFKISHSNFTDVNGGYHNTQNFYPSAHGQSVKLLQDASAAGASYNSKERYPPPRCLEGTRKRELETIKRWASEAGPPIMWLSGGMGAGKSAIAQTFAEWCADNNCLAASFFFRRGIEKRASTRCFCATLALQLVASLPGSWRHIGQVLDSEPSIFEMDLRTQFDKLVIRPFEAAFAVGASVPSVVVVDALDECDDPVAINEFLSVLDDTISSSAKRSPFRYLITSRPVHGIQLSFKRLTSFQSVALDASTEADNDIRFFVTTLFSEIRDKHKDAMALGPQRPIDEIVESIVRKSSGHFIYASTVLKFVGDEEAYPPDQLDIVLGHAPPSTGYSPFGALDELYHGILEHASKRNRELLKNILGYLVVSRFRATVPDMSTSLGCREVDVVVAIRSLRSLITKDDGLHAHVRFLHGSFPDFLQDSSRSDPFFVESGGYYERLAVRYLVLSRETMNEPDRFLFSLRNASYYLTQTKFPPSREMHIAFHDLILSPLSDKFPWHIRQHSPEQVTPDILRSLLNSTFTEIHSRHQSEFEALHTPTPWPSNLEFLVERLGLINCDQLFIVIVLVHFISRGYPPRRLDRLLRLLERRRGMLGMPDYLDQWIFYLVCDSDDRADLCLRTLALIGAAQKSGTELTSSAIQSFLDVSHSEIIIITQDLYPLIISRFAGSEIIFEARGRLTTSSLRREWPEEFKIGTNSMWRMDLALNCIRKQRSWIEGRSESICLGYRSGHLWIHILMECPSSMLLFAALFDIDPAAWHLTRHMASMVIEWLRMSNSQSHPPTLIRRWEEYHDMTEVLPIDFLVPPFPSSFSSVYNLEVPDMDGSWSLNNSENDFTPMTYDAMSIITCSHVFPFYNNEIDDLIYSGISRSGHLKSAVRLYASGLEQRLRSPFEPARSFDVDGVYPHLCTLLTQSYINTEDAIAALLVSMYSLQGRWGEWLQVAYTYVDNLIAQYPAGRPAAALFSCTEHEAFSPHFLGAIRAAFKPSGVCTGESSIPSQSLMMVPMGCENHVVWALAETSYLSTWKRKQTLNGSLSLPELVAKASEIETVLSHPADPNNLTSEIFRASTRLYLHTVVSGDYPLVSEIEKSVEETLQCIQRVEKTPPASFIQPSSSMTRPQALIPVFSLFICGAFAKQPDRLLILKKLKEKSYSESMVNFSRISDLLEHLWFNGHSNGTVEWRDMLKASHILLVGYH